MSDNGSVSDERLAFLVSRWAFYAKAHSAGGATQAGAEYRDTVSALAELIILRRLASALADWRAEYPIASAVAEVCRDLAELDRRNEADALRDWLERDMAYRHERHRGMLVALADWQRERDA